MLDDVTRKSHFQLSEVNFRLGMWIVRMTGYVVKPSNSVLPCTSGGHFSKHYYAQTMPFRFKYLIERSRQPQSAIGFFWHESTDAINEHVSSSFPTSAKLLSSNHSYHETDRPQESLEIINGKDLAVFVHRRRWRFKHVQC